jgi:hypothetical protein
MLDGIRSHISDYTDVPLRIFQKVISVKSEFDLDDIIISKEQLMWLYPHRENRTTGESDDDTDEHTYGASGSVHMCRKVCIARCDASFLTVDDIRNAGLPAFWGIDRNMHREMYFCDSDSESLDIEEIRSDLLGTCLTLEEGIALFCPFAPLKVVRFIASLMKTNKKYAECGWISEIFDYNRYVKLTQRHMQRIALILDMETWAQEKAERRDPITPDDIKKEYWRMYGWQARTRIEEQEGTLEMRMIGTRPPSS